MRVRCVAERPTGDQTQALSALFHDGKQTFGVSVGVEYLVFGLRFVKGVVLVDILQDQEQLYPVPLCLFEISDSRVPSLWRAAVAEKDAMFLWPPSFFDNEYYHEDLLDRVPDVVRDFREVRRMLELESESEPEM